MICESPAPLVSWRVLLEGLRAQYPLGCSSIAVFMARKRLSALCLGAESNPLECQPQSQPTAAVREGAATGLAACSACGQASRLEV